MANIVEDCIVGEMDDAQATFENDGTDITMRRCAVIPRRRYRKIIAMLRHVQLADPTIRDRVRNLIRGDLQFFRPEDEVD